MLAQSFKTAAELKITETEKQTLLKVLGMFERGEIGPNQFYMGTVESKHSCGTTMCIMGWCNHITGGKEFRLSAVYSKPSELVDGLFMFGDPRRTKINSPDAAAMALRSYLTTGDARWDLALAE